MQFDHYFDLNNLIHLLNLCIFIQVLLVHQASKGSFSRVFDFEASDLEGDDKDSRTRLVLTPIFSSKFFPDIFSLFGFFFFLLIFLFFFINFLLKLFLASFLLKRRLVKTVKTIQTIFVLY